jgi:hypothetical protein
LRRETLFHENQENGMYYPADIVDMEKEYNEKGESFHSWMLNKGWKESEPIREYLRFMRNMSTEFTMIFHKYVKYNFENGMAAAESDRTSIVNSVEELLQIARVFYILKSYGVQGDLLECGCYKGVSSCCLSILSDYFRCRLLIADSFSGLPDVKHNYYKPGQFCGSKDEVARNIEMYGKPNNVEYISGFFNTSLKNLNHPLALLWMDVDLYESALDVLNNALPLLDKHSVIFTHDILGNSIGEDMQFLPDAKDVAKGFRDYLKNRSLPYKAKHLTGTTCLVTFEDSLISADGYSPGNTLRLLDTPAPELNVVKNIINKRFNSEVRCKFSIDILKIDADGVEISGWVIDEDAAKPVSDMICQLNFASSNLFLPVEYGKFRTDIENIWKGCLLSGYRIKMPIIVDGDFELILHFINSENNSIYTFKRKIENRLVESNAIDNTIMSRIRRTVIRIWKTSKKFQPLRHFLRFG